MGSLARLTDDNGSPMRPEEVDILAALAVANRCMELMATSSSETVRRAVRTVAERALTDITRRQE